MRYLLLFLLLFTNSVCNGFQQDATNSSSIDKIALIRIEGTISPLTANYVSRGLKKAREAGNSALIIEMDTPGGLLDSTKDIVQQMLDSDDLPIIVYVSSQGGSATSAGTFITLAAHIAAMAPTTTIGAASPVQMSGGQTVQTDTVMQKKTFNYAQSYIESIAKKRGRNAEWAVAAVRDGESITAEKAVDLEVVDFIALNREDLLEQINGFKVEEQTLHVQNAQIEEIKPNRAEKWLSILIRPEVILILTMLAIYGIIGEVTNPGTIVPGVAGVISLILVLFASSVIPLNTAGFLLILLAVGLFVAEAFTPTFGLLIAGGAVSFFLGALMLFQDMPEPMSISWGWLIPSTIITVLFFIWIAFEGVRIHFRKPSTGVDTLVGKTAKVVDDIDENGGRVFVVGEYWNARSTEKIKAGVRCTIVKVERLTLIVEKTS